MSDSPIGRAVSSPLYHRHELFDLITSCLGGLDDVPARRGSRGPAVRWSPIGIALLLVGMMLDSGSGLTSRFDDVLAGLKSYLPAGLGRSFNGLLKATERLADLGMPAIKKRLRQRAVKILQDERTTGGWLLLAVDGSKEVLPRTRSNEQEFGIADNGLGPQAFITTIVSLGTGMALCWRIGEARSSERHHLADMLEELPEGALVVADAAFIGYPLWKQLESSHVAFLVRVGGNVSLIANLFHECRTEIQPGSQIVHVWPAYLRKDQPPLKLRLITIRTNNSSMYLLTNVLDEKRLSVELAGEIYRRRWRVELFYRTLKQTHGHWKLRSHRASRAMVEMDWIMTTLMVLAMAAASAARRAHQDPCRISPAAVLKVARRALRALPPTPRSGSLTLIQQLGQSLKDCYVRQKPKGSRVALRTRNRPAGTRGAPSIVPANSALRAQAARMIERYRE